MGDWEERINQVLNDPEQMEKLNRLAQSLMGGGGGAQSEAPSAGELGLDPELLGRVGRLLREERNEDRARLGLLTAMKPYLSPRRQEKLERAMKLARLSRLAKLTLGEEGGGHV